MSKAAADDRMRRLRLTEKNLAELIPMSDPIILVDEEGFGEYITRGRPALPFLERDGEYWGPPADDETAVSELERMRGTGARFVVVGWPAFWWLDHYTGLDAHLRSNYECVLRNERIVVFRLDTDPDSRDG